LHLLLELPKRGLPFFTDGLSYAIDRLRLYSGTTCTGRSQEDNATATSVVNILQHFATYSDLGAPVVTYTGLIPALPDASTLIPEVGEHEGLNIHEWIG
jgi:hypothetical protein